MITEPTTSPASNGLHHVMCRCPHCQATFPLEAAVRAQIEADVTTRLDQQREDEAERIREEAEQRAGAAADERHAVEIRTAHEDAAEQRAQNKLLRESLVELNRQLRALTTERESERLQHETALRAAEADIRTQVTECEAESHRLKELEWAKQLDDARQDTARLQARLDQGAPTTRGEVLELDIEVQLRELFPGDDITTVKTGVRGADVHQVVRTPLGEPCGLTLYETKNATWQPSWPDKLKDDMRRAGADHGVIVCAHLPEQFGSMSHLGGRIWAVRPRATATLAAVLRQTLLHTHAVMALRIDKGERIEALYRYITSAEFRHRIEAIQDFFTHLQDDDDKEQEWMKRKWARREKQIRIVVDNVLGLVGDFEGVNGIAILPALPPGETQDSDDA